MKRLILLGLCWAPLVVFLSRGGGAPGDNRPPPLSLEGLMDEALPEASPASRHMLAENQPCFVCHENYKTEELVERHARARIGCILCHGESFAHRNDEDNITPPEDMFAPDHVDGMCSRCHYEHRVSAREVIVRWQERCPAKTRPEEVNCTDCHFAHRLAYRNVRWDQKTRELLLRSSKPVVPPKVKAGVGG